MNFPFFSRKKTSQEEADEKAARAELIKTEMRALTRRMYILESLKIRDRAQREALKEMLLPVERVMFEEAEREGHFEAMIDVRDMASARLREQIGKLAAELKSLKQ